MAAQGEVKSESTTEAKVTTASSSADAKKPVVGILLWSGGLDSTLARHLLYKSCPNLKLYTFTVCSPFWKTKHTADIMVDIEDSYYDVLRHPKFHRGRGWNPCADCHSYMLRRAKEMMDELGACFVATGEVMGQRPNSQQKLMLPQIEEYTGLKGRLLRPLSAKLLEPTIPEQEHLLNRDAFEDIQGRSRKRQMQLGKELGLKDLPGAGGGCWLTIKEVSDKIKVIVEGRPKPDKRMFQLLPHSRFFHRDSTFIFVGRDREGCDFMRAFVAESPNDAGYRIVQNDDPGVPLVVIQGELTGSVKAYVHELVAKYSKPKKTAADGGAGSAEKSKIEVGSVAPEMKSEAPVSTPNK